MGPPLDVVDPFTGLRIDEDEDGKGGRASQAKHEKPRRRKAKPSDVASDGRSDGVGKSPTKHRPRGRRGRDESSSEHDKDDKDGKNENDELNDTDGKRKGSKGKKGKGSKNDKTHTCRPGEIGFEGLDDGGRSQSLYKGMSRGAVKKAVEKKNLEEAKASEPPPLDSPAIQTPLFDTCAHLHKVVEHACSLRDALRTVASAWRLGDAIALSCAPVGNVVHVTCDLESLDPSYGAPTYRSWERLFSDETMDGVTEESSSVSSTQAHPPRSSEVLFAFGVHPSVAHTVDSKGLITRIAQYIEETDAKAIGMVGLDFSKTGAGDEDEMRTSQIEILKKMFAIARGETNASGDSKNNPLPVLLLSIGGGDADDEILRVYAEHRSTCLASGASFVPSIFIDPSPHLFMNAISQFPHDAFISVSGAVMHSKNTQLLEVAFDVPLNRLVLASGAPGKMPTQLVGRQRLMGGSTKKPNNKIREWSHPASLVFAGEKIAQVKALQGVTVEQVVFAASENAKRVFGVE